MSDERPPDPGLPPTHTPYGAPPPPQQGPYGPPPPSYPAAPYGGPYGQPQPMYGGAPPRKDNTVKIVLIVFGVIGLLVLGGCLAVVGLVAKGVDEAMESVEIGGYEAVTEGAAFSRSGFSYQEGWSLGRDELRLLEVEGLVATNDTGSSGVAILSVQVHRGGRLLATSSCTGEPVEAGGTVTLTCISGDRLPRRYDRITVGGF